MRICICIFPIRATFLIDYVEINRDDCQHSDLIIRLSELTTLTQLLIACAGQDRICTFLHNILFLLPVVPRLVSQHTQTYLGGIQLAAKDSITSILSNHFSIDFLWFFFHGILSAGAKNGVAATIAPTTLAHHQVFQPVYDCAMSFFFLTPPYYDVSYSLID